MQKLAALTWAFMFFWMSFCKTPPDTKREPARGVEDNIDPAAAGSASDDKTKDATKTITDTDDDDDDATGDSKRPKPTTKQKNSDNDDDDGDDDDDDDTRIDLTGGDEPTKYPKVVFRGDGTLRHRGGTADITQDVWAKIETDTFTYNVSYFGATGGSNDGTVDREVRDSIGPVIFARPSDNDQFFATGDGKRARGFVVFARRAAMRNNKNEDKWSVVNFSAPVPVIITPGAESRYETLEEGPLRFETTASVGPKSIPAVYTITREAKTASTLQIKMELTLSADKEGELYQMLPSPKRTIFHVDTTTKRITKIETLSYYDSEDRDERMPITLDFDLCRLEFEDKTETIRQCATRRRN